MRAPLPTAIATVVLVGLIGGCAYVPADPDDPTEVAFDGEVSTTAGEFRMDGQVYANDPDGAVVEDVYICLYDEDRSLIGSHAVGDLDAASGSVPVSINRSTSPAYVVLESPDFWGDEARSHGYSRHDGQYERYSIDGISDRFWDADAGYLEEEPPVEDYTSCGDT